jgi:hypothetical protein
MLNLKYKAQESRKLLKMAQMCSKLHSVPVYRGILGQIFFSVIKKIWWHRWHSGQNRLEVLVLANNSCATTSISLGTAWHKWRKYWLFCNYALAHSLLGARDLFCFFENFFAQKSPYTVYRLI